MLNIETPESRISPLEGNMIRQREKDVYAGSVLVTAAFHNRYVQYFLCLLNKNLHKWKWKFVIQVLPFNTYHYCITLCFLIIVSLFSPSLALVLSCAKAMSDVILEDPSLTPLHSFYSTCTFDLVSCVQQM